jgi:hypothetical protein
VMTAGGRRRSTRRSRGIRRSYNVQRLEVIIMLLAGFVIGVIWKLGG